MTARVLSTDEVEALLALANAATPGPWEECEMSPEFAREPGEIGIHIPGHPDAFVKPDGTWHSITACRGMSGSNKDANAAFIARARTAVPALCASVEALRADNARLREALARARNALKGNGPDGSDECDECHGKGYLRINGKQVECPPCAEYREALSDVLAEIDAALAPSGEGGAT